MAESKLDGEASTAAVPTPITDAADVGLPGLQQLWDETIGAILKLCQDAAAADSTRQAPSDDQAAVEDLQDISA